MSWVKYESSGENLSWEKNTETGRTRNENDLLSLDELKSQLEKAKSRVKMLERAVEATENRK